MNRLAVHFALASVVLFTFIDSGVKFLVSGYGLPIFFLARALTDAVLCTLVLLAVSWDCRESVKIHFRSIDRIVSRRALVLVAMEVSFTLALANAGDQVLAYPLFFLHPFWQLLFARKYGGRSPGWRQIAQVLVIVIGVAVYIWSTDPLKTYHEQKEPLRNFIGVFVFPFVAGICFAYVNEMGNLIAEKSKRIHFRFLDMRIDPPLFSIRLMTHTSIAAARVALPVFALLYLFQFVAEDYGSATDVFGIVRLRGADPARQYILLAAYVAVGVLATWLSTLAFVKTKTTGKIAAIDGASIVVGALIDLSARFFTSLPNQAAFSPHPAALMAGLAIIVIGVALSALLKDE